jgi:sugar phosphate isomerase/epimerase
LLASGASASSTSRRDTWQIGCYTRPWAAFDYRKALDAIAEAGFKYAGLMTTRSTKSQLVVSVETSPEEAQQVGREARQRGLEIPSIYGGGFPVQKSIEAGIAGLRRIIDACAAAGSKTLLLGGIGDDKLYEPYFSLLSRIRG